MVIYYYVHIKCTLVQTLRHCTGRTARKGSRGIALPFHNHGTRRGEGLTSRPRYVYRIQINEEQLSTGMVPGIIQGREKIFSF